VTGIEDDLASEPGARPAAGDPIAAVEARLDVDAALTQVPEEFRVAVALRDLADLDYAEIAEALDVPVGTVKSRVNRGRSALRDALEDAAPGNQDPVARRPSETP